MASLGSGEPGGTVYCFICGGAMLRGRELQLPVRCPPEPGGPFFPFLAQQEPAPGASEPSADGTVPCCAVCQHFLAEQWSAFERRRTPLDKRMYWLKRPYQCGGAVDPRKPTPREWNPAYEDALNTRGDSELSSLSEDETLSEPEQEASHTRPLRAPCAHTPVQDIGALRGKAGQNVLHIKQPEWSQGARNGRAGQATAHAQHHKEEAQQALPTAASPLISRSGPGQRDCSSEDINITSDDDEYRIRNWGEAKKENGVGPTVRHCDGITPTAVLVAGGTACYICGSRLSQASLHQIHVQKQEHPPHEPFFPFLWLHNPPPGAQPISPSGSTLVCPCCFSSLMQQWQSFEVASVPVLQRLYMVPLNAKALGMPSKDGAQFKVETVPAGHEVCYLCGEDTKEAKLVACKVTNGNARNTMHFPFLGQLPCPPNSKGLTSKGEASSCRKCYGVLEDIWAIYRACQTEELITSVQSFLGRYHQVFSMDETNVMPSRRGHVVICYICGSEMGAGQEFQLNVNPPNRYGDKEPFFPFLTVYPPAPRARPADSIGLVSTCSLCYHDLLGQWLQHEGRSTLHPSSPWSRQYKVETFVCFFCRLEKKRCLGLKAVRVARLPIFLYTPRVSNSLLVDDGKELTIGTCAECRAVVLAGKVVTNGDLLGPRPPSTKEKVRRNNLYSFFYS
ncbi:hypothetical protein NDU88_004389 [Pleurodeles waltl]|uniref:C2H2-type domain-containing protein n=1 Tax=Pleurodeles waltl TaxID=8319 RepID=A0AAV7KY93_PLEWA|nr:hypothetical protein NDU88_004389 [Pleurodeles waltl]